MREESLLCKETNTWKFGNTKGVRVYEDFSVLKSTKEKETIGLGSRRPESNGKYADKGSGNIGQE